VTFYFTEAVATLYSSRATENYPGLRRFSLSRHRGGTGSNYYAFAQTSFQKTLSHVYPVTDGAVFALRLLSGGIERGWEKDNSLPGIEKTEIPGIRSAARRVKTIILRSDCPTTMTPFANINETPPKACKVRPDPCCLGSGRNLLSLPPFLSSLHQRARGKAGVIQSFAFPSIRYPKFRW